MASDEYENHVQETQEALENNDDGYEIFEQDSDNPEQAATIFDWTKALYAEKTGQKDGNDVYQVSLIYRRRDFHERGLGEGAAALFGPIEKIINKIRGKEPDEQPEYGIATEEIEIQDNYEEQDKQDFFDDLLHSFQQANPYIMGRPDDE